MEWNRLAQTPVSMRATVAGLGLVVLVGSAFLLMRWTQDGIARSQAIATIEQLRGLVDMEGEVHASAGKPTPEDIHRLLGRGPDNPGDLSSRRVVQEYLWDSPYHTYRLILIFERDAQKTLRMTKAKAYGPLWGPTVGPSSRVQR